VSSLNSIVDFCQIQELVNYIARGQSEEQRASFIRPFQDALKTEESSKPLEEDQGRRQAIFLMVLAQVKGVGDGSDKGKCYMPVICHHSLHLGTEIEGFFNLLFAHLLSLYPIDSPEIRQHLVTLLPVISSSTTENATVKYRV
jgi:translation initiation factor 3 subunit M